MQKRNLLRGLFVTVLLLAMINFSLALEPSNESLQAFKSLETAKSAIEEMQKQTIPVTRVNEIYQEAYQIYTAQVALENSKRTANYNLVNEDSAKIIKIKADAIKAKDELTIFLATYDDAKTETNLTEMNSLYKEIVFSYSEERFEDTPGLIEKGYTKLSELQSSQTATRLFYSTLSNTLKNFLIQNWIKLVSAAAVIIIALIIFWRTLKIMNIKRKIKNLEVKKQTLNGLVKKLQLDYFKAGKISENEYKIKLEKFKEMMRDIERQIPLLKENLAKASKEKTETDKKIQVSKRK